MFKRTFEFILKQRAPANFGGVVYKCFAPKELDANGDHIYYYKPSPATVAVAYYQNDSIGYISYLTGDDQTITAHSRVPSDWIEDGETAEDYKYTELSLFPEYLNYIRYGEPNDASPHDDASLLELIPGDLFNELFSQVLASAENYGLVESEQDFYKYQAKEGSDGLYYIWKVNPYLSFVLQYGAGGTMVVKDGQVSFMNSEDGDFLFSPCSNAYAEEFKNVVQNGTVEANRAPITKRYFSSLFRKAEEYCEKFLNVAPQLLLSETELNLSVIQNLLDSKPIQINFDDFAAKAAHANGYNILYNKNFVWIFPISGKKGDSIFICRDTEAVYSVSFPREDWDKRQTEVHSILVRGTFETISGLREECDAQVPDSAFEAGVKLTTPQKNFILANFGG